MAGIPIGQDVWDNHQLVSPAVPKAPAMRGRWSDTCVVCPKVDMNGRCETDPFDRAVDVCRTCYGEFCWTCLVETKGNKHPLCRDCALIVGGLRPKTKPTIRGDKKTAKARRELLRPARDQPRPGAGFTYFDTGELFEEQISTPVPGGRRKDDPEPNEDGDGEEPEDERPPSEVADSPAVRRLASIRQADSPFRTPTPTTDGSSTGSAAQAPRSEPTSPSATSVAGQPGATPTPPEEHRLGDEEALVAEFRKPRRYIDQQARAPQTQEPADGQVPTLPQAPASPGVAQSPPWPQAPASTANPVTAEEPVHIHDDPWARTGPEAISTASLPKRRPDPRPSEDTSEEPPEWTKAKLPKRQ